MGDTDTHRPPPSRRRRRPPLPQPPPLPPPAATPTTTLPPTSPPLASVSFLSIFQYLVTNVARCARLDTSSINIDSRHPRPPPPPRPARPRPSDVQPLMRRLHRIRRDSDSLRFAIVVCLSSYETPTVFSAAYSRCERSYLRKIGPCPSFFSENLRHTPPANRLQLAGEPPFSSN